MVFRHLFSRTAGGLPSTVHFELCYARGARHLLDVGLCLSVRHIFMFSCFSRAPVSVIVFVALLLYLLLPSCVGSTLSTGRLRLSQWTSGKDAFLGGSSRRLRYCASKPVRGRADGLADPLFFLPAVFHDRKVRINGFCSWNRYHCRVSIRLVPSRVWSLRKLFVLDEHTAKAQ